MYLTVNYYHTLGSCFQRKYCYVSQGLYTDENNYTSHVSARVRVYELRRRKLWDNIYYISVRDRAVITVHYVPRDGLIAGKSGQTDDRGTDTFITNRLLYRSEFHTVHGDSVHGRFEFFIILFSCTYI
jgi:hypothetical protein